MPDYSESIVVDAPPRVVYDFWRRVEDYPIFMSDVAAVRDLGRGRLQWRGHFGDDDIWETELLDDSPGVGMAWHSTSGSPLIEAVELADLGDGRTRVTWTRRRERDKGDLGELFLGAFGTEMTTLRANLEAFKRHVELRSAVRALGERAVGATRDEGAAVARGEAPGVGPAIGPEGAQGITPPDEPAFGAGLSAPGGMGQTGDRDRKADKDDDEQPAAPYSGEHI